MNDTPTPPKRKRPPRPLKRLDTAGLKLATKRAYRAARAAGKPIKWSAARERAFAWERGRAGDHMWGAS